jgi:hypothetical protein
MCAEVSASPIARRPPDTVVLWPSALLRATRVLDAVVIKLDDAIVGDVPSPCSPVPVPEFVILNWVGHPSSYLAAPDAAHPFDASDIRSITFAHPGSVATGRRSAPMSVW